MQINAQKKEDEEEREETRERGGNSKDARSCGKDYSLNRKTNCGRARTTRFTAAKYSDAPRARESRDCVRVARLTRTRARARVYTRVRIHVYIREHITSSAHIFTRSISFSRGIISEIKLRHAALLNSNLVVYLALCKMSFCRYQRFCRV